MGYEVRGTRYEVRGTRYGYGLTKEDQDIMREIRYDVMRFDAMRRHYI